MTRSELLRLEVRRSHARRELLEDLATLVEAGDATSVLVRAVDGMGTFRAHARFLGVRENTLRSAWFRSGCPPWVAVHDVIRLHVLRSLLGLGDVSVTAAALVAGFPATQHAHRLVRRATGGAVRPWIARTAPERTRAAWQSLLRASAGAFQGFRVPPPMVERVRAHGAVRVLKRSERVLEGQLADVRAQLAALGAA